MPRRFSNAPLKSTDPASADKLNPLFVTLDAAIAALEAVRMDWEAQILQFNTNGLRRVSEAIQPLISQLNAIVDGGLLVAQTDDLVEIVQGEEVDFFIPVGARVGFRPTPFLAITSPDEYEDWAAARLVSYSDVSGLLRVEILYLNGSGAERTGWTISASSGVVDAVHQWFVDTGIARNEAVDAAEAVLAAAVLIAGGPVSTVAGLAGVVTASALRAALGLMIGDTVQAFDGDLTAIAALTPANNDFLQRKSDAWTNRTIAQVKTDLGISSFAETLLDDTSAVAMRATIGAINGLVPFPPITITGSPTSVVLTGIPATGYSHFMLVGHNVVTDRVAINDVLYLEVSTDGGATFKTASGDYRDGTGARAALTQFGVPSASASFKYGGFLIDLIGLGNAGRATMGSIGYTYAAVSTGNITITAPGSAISVRAAIEADTCIRLRTEAGAAIVSGTVQLVGVLE